MGIKIINSREYREVCERVAFLESDLNDAKREIDAYKRVLETKDETIKSLKKDIVNITEKFNAERVANSELKNNIADLETAYEVLKTQSSKEETVAEEKPAKKPRATRRTKKD